MRLLCALAEGREVCVVHTLSSFPNDAIFILTNMKNENLKKTMDEGGKMTHAGMINQCFLRGFSSVMAI